MTRLKIILSSRQLPQQRLQNKITLPKSQTASRSMTMAEKMLAMASGNDYIQPCEVVFAQVDLAMSHDAVTKEYLQDKEISKYESIIGDKDAILGDRRFQFDLSQLEAQIACPL